MEGKGMPIVKGLGWTFDTEAERLRPGYVEALYRDIFAYVPLGENSRAVEVGIGGGQATRPILETGCGVVAVEPGANFVALCRRKFQEYPNFAAVEAAFEEYDGGEETCDLVYSASAFHWVPEAVGYPKVWKMLKSGGAFARFANHPYKDKGRPEIDAALQKIYAVYMPGSLAGAEYGWEDAERRAEAARKYGFTDLQCRLYHRTRTYTAREYVELLGTYSDHIAIEENARKRFFAEIEAAIENLGGKITLYDTIDLQLARKP
jgi:SAM-dependent methyltransferase